jgi:hypothetical protein
MCYLLVEVHRKSKRTKTLNGNIKLYIFYIQGDKPRIPPMRYLLVEIRIHRFEDNV